MLWFLTLVNASTRVQLYLFLCNRHFTVASQGHEYFHQLRALSWLLFVVFFLLWILWLVNASTSFELYLDCFSFLSFYSGFSCSWMPPPTSRFILIPFCSFLFTLDSHAREFPHQLLVLSWQLLVAFFCQAFRFWCYCCCTTSAADLRKRFLISGIFLTHTLSPYLVRALHYCPWIFQGFPQCSKHRPGPPVRFNHRVFHKHLIRHELYLNLSKYDYKLLLVIIKAKNF